jgi:hypothetical protein
MAPRQGKKVRPYNIIARKRTDKWLLYLPAYAFSQKMCAVLQITPK